MNLADADKTPLEIASDKLMAREKLLESEFIENFTRESRQIGNDRCLYELIAVAFAKTVARYIKED
jgi:hypothetical protein